jgi:3'-phosphoadenosine 5'-phosphosulfate (PAPS) 3'-phosphatase
MDRDFKTLLPPVTDLVLSAGREIMGVYATDRVEVRRKADDSPLTEADCCCTESLQTTQRAGKHKFPPQRAQSRRKIGTKRQ